MKISQKIKIEIMDKELNSILNNFREKRNFNVKEYLNNKINIINKYFKENKLDTAVIAVSGGIDSAIVLGILYQSIQQPNTAIKKIFPVFIPCNSEFATNQDTAYEKAKILCKQFNLKLNIINITELHKNICHSIKSDLKIKGDNWSDGQMVSYFRTSTLYYTTSLLTANGMKPVIIGTTNKDEGAYTGYFGKASDGMVDIQLISDIHKFEVYQLSDYLGITSEIKNSIPTGDMFDGRKDEEVFGAPYDFVELYYYINQLNPKDKLLIEKKLSEQAFKNYSIMYSNIENMHRYNKHKYYGCSPSVHLDVLDYNIKNGWFYKNYKSKTINNAEYGDHKEW